MQQVPLPNLSSILPSLLSFLRNTGSIVSIVVGALEAITAAGNTGKITAGGSLALIGGILQAVEHHNAGKIKAAQVTVASAVAARDAQMPRGVALAPQPTAPAPAPPAQS